MFQFPINRVLQIAIVALASTVFAGCEEAEVSNFECPPGQVCTPIGATDELGGETDDARPEVSPEDVSADDDGQDDDGAEGAGGEAVEDEDIEGDENGADEAGTEESGGEALEDEESGADEADTEESDGEDIEDEESGADEAGTEESAGDEAVDNAPVPADPAAPPVDAGSSEEPASGDTPAAPSAEPEAGEDPVDAPTPPSAPTPTEPVAEPEPVEEPVDAPTPPSAPTPSEPVAEPAPEPAPVAPNPNLIRDLVVSLDRCPRDYAIVGGGAGIDLNGDLNEGAGGHDIYLCFSKDVSRGAPITDVAITQEECPGGFQRVAEHNGSNGDLNQDAGGRDIFVCTRRDASREPLVNLVLDNDREAPCVSQGMTPVRTGTDLNGDLNQGSGGADIFLCLDNGTAAPVAVAPVQPTPGPAPAPPNPNLIRDVVVSLNQCPGGYTTVLARAGVDLNGDLNEGAGGFDIFLCYSKDVGRGAPITDLAITEDQCPGGFSRVAEHNGSNGDLNQDAGGKDIFVCASRNAGGSPLTDISLDNDRQRPCAGLSPARVGSTLNGDLNQGSGGADIFLCTGR